VLSNLAYFIHAVKMGRNRQEEIGQRTKVYFQIVLWKKGEYSFS
jgi:hypothetical protein